MDAVAPAMQPKMFAETSTWGTSQVENELNKILIACTRENDGIDSLILGVYE